IECVSPHFQGIQQPRIVEIAFGDDAKRPPRSGPLQPGDITNFSEDMPRAEIINRVNGVEAKAIEVKVAQPLANVVKNVTANSIAAAVIVVPRRSPRC